MPPNLVNQLPLPVYPIDHDRADYALSKNRLSDYFIRNPILFQRALEPQFTAHAVQMAAHACDLWFDTWTNPDSRRTVLVVANKDVMPLKAMFQRTLNNQSVIAALLHRS
ncbi:hypothetical protein [Neisseria iguanae]|uniref:Uncharacterized protein n=1 Tax=Neisseria iguanae TaxID=90242 RepID=A0A2P7TZ92_9NEIS|nr:hypothetical protein [Neisseria iguanae]PSJ80048.1 hypothetical protein C7N83_08630 [Neisseria iguanae]